MKKLMTLLFFITLSLTNIVQAEDFQTGLVSVEAVSKLGLIMKMGELTGAGSKFRVNTMAGLILPEGVLMKEDCTGIVVKNVADPKISDIIKIKIQDREILASEFVGFVVK